MSDLEEFLSVSVNIDRCSARNEPAKNLIPRLALENCKSSGVFSPCEDAINVTGCQR
jgi:hypothetical protein